MPTDPLQRIEEHRRKKMKKGGGDTAVSVSVISTGAGPDGVVQPHYPTGVLNTQNGPAMIHEGEQIVDNGNGSVDVIPYQQGNQASLMMGDFSPGGYQEVENGYRGGACGVKMGMRGGGRVMLGYANGDTDIAVDPLATTTPPADTTTATGPGAIMASLRL